MLVNRRHLQHSLQDTKNTQILAKNKTFTFYIKIFTDI